ncbi:MULTISPECIES: PilW family protein [Pseudoalteromonas]|uniref:Type IV pilus assembly protein PilW n=2 Tax=Pseudoalteromonas TaxID=53246 RepID=A0A290S5V1_9GAMM|nr:MULTISPECIES: PilW family protein [Pseudoalteromonas]ATC87299.1 type IV pilus assembly protein PilW [Pseudoalteromonas arctica A 37-1-2]KHM44426.1 pilus assembly protein PilW [Pseudoalteromonas elyakovii]KID39743.1 pilus assembly protein PilW [Pseudoalteromonas distincta]MBZ2191886.1 PilW family protein [Pseudoalteromonas arctica]MCK8102080.1 PilW family protein [Pseudoalteromonas sp. 2CM36K]
MKQKGFTLVEVMISLFIGGLILGGVMFTFISMKLTTKDTMAIGELQESGRLAINIMQRDIEQVGFWGTYYDDSFTAVNTTVSSLAPTKDCVGADGTNNGSFPDLTSSSNFRTIYAETAESTSELNCIGDATQGSDILQLKFLQGNLQYVPTYNDDGTITYENKTTGKDNSAVYFFIAEQEQAKFVTGEYTPTNDNVTIWPYTHHVYYISEQEYEVNNKKIKVPVLKRKRLVKGKMTNETIMEGVENMRFIFGLDTNSDSKVDTYKSIEKIASSEWENRKGILTVQVFLLVRALQPDPGLKIKNQKYTLGEGAGKRDLTFNDNYRRTVFTTTIRLSNVGGNLWKI